MAEEYDDEDEDAGEDDYGDEGLEETYERPGWLREMPYWAISAVLHLILVLIMVGIVVVIILATLVPLLQITSSIS